MAKKPERKLNLVFMVFIFTSTDTIYNVVEAFIPRNAANVFSLNQTGKSRLVEGCIYPKTNLTTQDLRELLRQDMNLKLNFDVEQTVQAGRVRRLP